MSSRHYMVRGGADVGQRRCRCMDKHRWWGRLEVITVVGAAGRQCRRAVKHRGLWVWGFLVNFAISNNALILNDS